MNRHPVALIVDDSMLIRHIVCRFLEERGFRVESATNGAEALDILTRIHANIILTDLEMPKMNGRELIRALKASPSTAHIPVVVLTRKRYKPEETALPGADHVIFKEGDIGPQLEKVLKAIGCQTDSPQD